jgi:hypothetical protein
MTFPDGNHSGFANDERAALDARYGLVVYGWELRVCLNAVVSSPTAACSNSAAEWSMDEQARRVKAINPLTRVFHYRNTMQALSPFRDQCLKMHDASYGGFFLRQADRATGPPINRVADPRSLEPCQPSILPRGCRLPWGCRAIQMDQYVTDFTNASAAAWFVDTVIGHAANSSTADGVWFDDVGGTKVDDARAAEAKGYPRARLVAIGAAANATALRAEQLLKSRGKWSFNTPGGFVTLPAVTNVTSQCVSALLQGVALAAKAPSVMYVDYFEPPVAQPGQPQPPTTACDFQQRLAAFLLVRGNYSWFGHGWITSKPPAWYPEWDYDVGVPLGPMQQNGSTFARRWSKGVVSLDCASFTAKFGFRAPPPRPPPPPPPPPSPSHRCTKVKDVGCYDDSTFLALPNHQPQVHDKVTFDTCASACSTFGSSLAGIDAGNHCYCGKAVAAGASAYSRPMPECQTTPCHANPNEKGCGGVHRMLVYSFECTKAKLKSDDDRLEIGSRPRPAAPLTPSHSVAQHCSVRGPR